MRVEHALWVACLFVWVDGWVVLMDGWTVVSLTHLPTCGAACIAQAGGTRFFQVRPGIHLACFPQQSLVVQERRGGGKGGGGEGGRGRGRGGGGGERGGGGILVFVHHTHPGLHVGAVGEEEGEEGGKTGIIEHDCVLDGLGGWVGWVGMGWWVGGWVVDAFTYLCVIDDPGKGGWEESRIECVENSPGPAHGEVKLHVSVGVEGKRGYSVALFHACVCVCVYEYIWMNVHS